MTDQPGRDPEKQTVPEDYTSLRNLYGDSARQVLRVIMSVFDKNGQLHNAVVPKPISYDAAILIAFHQLAEFIPLRTESTLDDVYFQYRMKGTDIWTKFAHEFWKEMVLDGDELRVCVKPVITPDNRLDSEEGNTTVNYIQLLQRPDELGIVKSSKGRVVVFPRPQSFAEAKIVARVLFYRSKSSPKLSIFVRKGPTGGPWVIVDEKVRKERWLTLTRSRTEIVEIAVWADD